MKNILYVALLVGLSTPLGAQQATVAGPDNRLKVEVFVEKGRPLYSVSYDGNVVLEKSPLGLETSVGDFHRNMTWQGDSIGHIQQTYQLDRIKHSTVHYEANELTCRLTNAKGWPLQIIFRVSNQDIAFRYHLPQTTSTACCVVKREATGFDFPQQTTTFLCPQASPMSGWERTKPSYEEEYTPDEPIGTPSKEGLGYTFPCLFHVEDSHWVLLSETGVDGAYCGGHLGEGSANGLYTLAFPHPGENNGVGSATASIPLPGGTPWRTITVGDNLKPIVETTIPFDVVTPKYEPSIPYQYGRSTWSWILWQDGSINYDDQVKFIDLAAAMGYEYTLVDNWWDTRIGRGRIEELSAYAQSKGVHLFLWYNSNGHWSDAPQGPKQCMNSATARKREMKWLHDIGVKGIKVDFFAGDKQETIQLYEDILSDANEAGLMVVFHGCTLPRGWERMYPNYVGSEAVLASENLVFNQHFDDLEAQNACLHPFIRNTVGCMEFGGVFLNKRLNRTNDGGTFRRTSDLFQLSLAVLFQNPIQNFALAPNNLTDADPVCLDFLRRVPTTWDETRFLEGYPGKYCVLARRKGHQWYVAGINAEASTRRVSLQLPMLAHQTVELYTEGDQGHVQKRNVTLDEKGEVELTIPSNGGALVTFAPEQVYLGAWSASDKANRGGLQLAWSSDRTHWQPVGNGMIYLYSDYGNWGTEKRMFHPQLLQDNEGLWHSWWQVNDREAVLAHTTSPDLIHWTPQSYYPTSEQATRFPLWNYVATAESFTVAGKPVQGQILSAPLSVVENLDRYAEWDRQRQALFSERCEQDPVRFADLQPLEATLRIRPTESKAISPDLMGIFFEDINYAADGGLYAELIQNRDFEYDPADKQGQDPAWKADYAWELRTLANATEAGSHFAIDTKDPLHPNNAHFGVWQVNQPNQSALVNSGYDGICVRKGERYDFSLFARMQSGKAGALRVCLMTPDEQVIAESRVAWKGKAWQQQTAELVATVDTDQAQLYLIPENRGTYAVDLISLFPRNTFKGRKNGLRADLAQTLADLHPRFVRFPGGCVAHGDGIGNIYRWKQTIGPLESRKPMRNLWNYHQSVGLGYFEYFQFCEDIGAEPVPVLAAGVPCQNSSCGGAGQQGGIPMHEMDAYIQDILDLVEYANGDPATSVWARKRAEAGHPEPFNLKYIGIGNEDLISDVFTERFTQIYQAVRAAYPEITVIGTVGPFNEGSDYEAGWALADQLQVPIVDEHYYQTPGWFIHNQQFYDRYDRNRSKVYLGEYASHLPGRPNNIETALSEALYLTHVERNGDVVHMSSYAPLLAKEGHTQWNPDLIYFNNREVKPTVGYYVQQLYGQHGGTAYIGNRLEVKSERKDVQVRVASSVVRDAESGDLIVKLVNLLPVAVTTRVEVTGDTAWKPMAQRIVLQGKPTDQQARPQADQLAVGATFDCPLPAYSFTIVRLSAADHPRHE